MSATFQNQNQIPILDNHMKERQPDCTSQSIFVTKMQFVGRFAGYSKAMAQGADLEERCLLKWSNIKRGLLFSRYCSVLSISSW